MPTPKTYTLDEKIALVTAIQERYRVGGRSLKAIAAELGTTDTSYQNWLRAGIRPTSKPATSRRYSPDERRELLAKIDQLREEGHSLESACKEAGISDCSYRSWKLDAAPPAAMRPVEITALVPAMPAAPPAPETPLSLVTPGGYRVEGLSAASAAELLRALQ